MHNPVLLPLQNFSVQLKIFYALKIGTTLHTPQVHTEWLDVVLLNIINILHILIASECVLSDLHGLKVR